MERQCPDCDVTMEPVTLSAGGGGNVHARTEDQRDGLLGSLGLTGSHRLEGRLCPECGLVRTYADVGGQDKDIDDDHWLADGESDGSDTDDERQDLWDRDESFDSTGRDVGESDDDSGWL